MPLDIPDNASIILDRIIADIRTELPNSNPSLRESFLLAIATATALRLFDANLTLDQAVTMLFPDTAIDDFAERWGTLVGIALTPAQPAAGNVIATGTAGGIIPVATLLSNAEALQYQVLSEVTIGDVTQTIDTLVQAAGVATATFLEAHNIATGQLITLSGANESEYNFVNGSVTVTSTTQFTYTVDAGAPTPATGTIIIEHTSASVSIRGVDTGLQTNADSGEVLTFNTSLIDVDPNPIVDFTGLVDGLDVQSSDEYRDEYLDIYANGRAPFSESSIIRTAKQVQGVTRVWVKPITPTLGDTTIYFVKDGREDIIPTAEEIADVREHLVEQIMPPNMDQSTSMIIVAPTPEIITFTFTALSPDTPDMRTAILNSLIEFFADTADFETDIQEQAYQGAIFRTIDATGATVISFTLSAPTGDISIGAGEIAVLDRDIGFP